MESRRLVKQGVGASTLLHEPPDIYLDDHIMDIKFAPSANVLALGQVTGDIRIYTYSEEATNEVLHFDYHADSCRRVEFSPDGNILYSVSTDQSIGIISQGRLEGKLTQCHDAPINCVVHVDAGHIIATGDDDGTIKIWDLRQAAKKSGASITFEEHDGTISDMVINSEKQMLLAAANDGCLGVFDLRKPELYAMSDNFEEDLTSLVLCKHEKKVLVGTGEGVINIFSWDWFGDCNDRIVGHPNSIDTMVKYDEDLVITGSEDGLLRAVSVLPNKIIAILGDPTDLEDEQFHIQRVTLSHDRALLASCSLDDIVKIIDVQHLGNRMREEFDEEEYEAKIKTMPKREKKEKKKRKQSSDMEEDKGEEEEEKKGGDRNMQEDEGENEGWDTDSEDDSDEDSSDEEQSKNKKKNKQLNQKTMNVKRSKKLIEQAKKKQFFDDL